MQNLWSCQSESSRNGLPRRVIHVTVWGNFPVMSAYGIIFTQTCLDPVTCMGAVIFKWCTSFPQTAHEPLLKLQAAYQLPPQKYQWPDVQCRTILKESLPKVCVASSHNAPLHCFICKSYISLCTTVGKNTYVIYLTHPNYMLWITAWKCSSSSLFS
jgi:hypothetical protein